MNNPMTQPTMNNVWLSEIFRLTVFFQAVEETEFTNWWKHIAGDDPENRNSQPKIKTLQDEGPYEGGQLVVSVQVNRADLLFLPSFDKNINMPNPEKLLPFDAGRNIFENLVKRWLEVSPELSRIAFGTILDIPVPNKIAGYNELAKYLTTINIDSDESSDFLYQINRPRKSNVVPNLKINRLSKWAVAIAELNVIKNLSFAATSQETLLTRLEMDINTFPGNKENLPRDKYYEIFSELLSLAVELSQKGDVR